MTRRLALGLALFCALRFIASAQTGGYLTVRSAEPGPRVMIDSLLVGTAPFDSLPIPAGDVVLRVLPPRPTEWSSSLEAETLHVLPGSHLVRDGSLFGVSRVTSEPYGAAVFLGDSIVGTTPLFVPSRLGGRVLRFSLDGFDDASALLSGNLHVSLLPRTGSAEKALAPSSARNMTTVYLAAGASILTGATAAYCKIRADARYADYRRTGSSDDLDEVRRLDRLSGISLAVSEIAFFVLTYQLFSR